jgi:hypothetical protein
VREGRGEREEERREDEKMRGMEFDSKPYKL